MPNAATAQRAKTLARLNFNDLTQQESAHGSKLLTSIKSGPEEKPLRLHNVGSVKREEPTGRRSTVWIALILLLGSLYVFWVLPAQLGSRPVQVEFESAPGDAKPSQDTLNPTPSS